jgi:hypothetical protein
MEPAYPHPTIPDADVSWPTLVIAGVLLMFVCAAVVGPIARMEMPEEVPPAHSHDEPPGASGHHGAGGTIQPGPDDAHGSGHAAHH